MADSGAARQARYKAHRAGDHRLCRHDADRRALVVVPLPVGDAGELDAAEEMRKLAARLAAAHEAEPGNAALARELRATLVTLMRPGEQVDPELAALFRAFSS